MHSSLQAFYSRCAAIRDKRPPVGRVFQDALQALGWSSETMDEWRALPDEAVASAGPQARLFRAALTVAEQVELDTVAAYHNRDHTAEAILAAQTLMTHEPLSDAAKRNQGLVLLSAMLAHDVGHTGAFGSPKGVLEDASTHTFMRAWDAFGPTDVREARERNLIGSIILGTEFSEGPKTNAARFAANPHSLCPRLHVLANDADIMASVLPETGPERGRLLGLEWEASGPAAAAAAATVASWAGRLGFLKVASMASDAARALGVEELRQAEIQAIEALSPQALASMSTKDAQTAVWAHMTSRQQQRQRLTA